MKKIITILILSFSATLFSQTVTYNKDSTRLIIESKDQLILKVSFRTKKENSYLNYDDSKVFNVGKNKIVVPIHMIEDKNEVLIELVTKIAVKEF